MLLGINSFNYKSFQKGKFYIDVYVVVQFSNQFHFLKLVLFFKLYCFCFSYNYKLHEHIFKLKLAGSIFSKR